MTSLHLGAHLTTPECVQDDCSRFAGVSDELVGLIESEIFSDVLFCSAWLRSFLVQGEFCWVSQIESGKQKK
jgi:hypothetical protein